MRRRRPRVIAFGLSLTVAGLCIGVGLRVALFTNPLLGLFGVALGVVLSRLSMEAYT